MVKISFQQLDDLKTKLINAIEVRIIVTIIVMIVIIINS